MKKSTDGYQKIDAHYFLDITADTCPMTFVRTKLLIEQMGPGEIAEIRLTGVEPTRNVPRSISQHGHRVLSVRPESEAGTILRLYFQKQP